MGLAMSDPKLPPYLERQRGSRVIDRSRTCPHDDDDKRATCRVCRGTGIKPSLREKAIAAGHTPMPPDHPARSRESYIPGLDTP